MHILGIRRIRSADVWIDAIGEGGEELQIGARIDCSYLESAVAATRRPCLGILEKLVYEKKSGKGSRQFIMNYGRLQVGDEGRRIR